MARKARGMDLRQLQDILTGEIERLSNLREHLSPGEGQPLTIQDKKDIRNVLAGNWLDDMNREAEYFFRSGSVSDYHHNREYVSVVLAQFS